MTCTSMIETDQDWHIAMVQKGIKRVKMQTVLLQMKLADCARFRVNRKFPKA